MKVRSVGELVERLDEDLKWRKKEMTTLWLELERERRPHLRAILTRSFVCLLYAHWEGFVKQSAEVYLRYIQSCGESCHRLGYGLVAASIRDMITACGTSKDFVKHRELVETIHTLKGLPNFKFYPSIIDTRSNVDEEVFKEIADIIGLDLSHYLSSLPKITEMRNTRNRISHGEDHSPTFDDCQVFKDKAVDLMMRMKDDIENAAVARAFLRVA